MTKYLTFNFDPDADDDYWDASDALKSLIKQYDNLSKSVLKAERQLMKFDEINKLVATEVKEKTTGSSKSSGGSTKSSSTKSTSSKSSNKSSGTGSTGKKDLTTTQAKTTQKQNTPVLEEAVPLYVAIQDVLFNWDDLNWEDIMMKLIAGLTGLGGAFIGWLVGGVPGAIIGLAAGLLFGIALDDTIFNFDGELSSDEIWKSLTVALGTIGGGIIGFMAMGPVGAVIGITLGTVLSFAIAKINWDDVRDKLDAFFTDLNENFDVRWESFRRLVKEKFAGIKNWFSSLSFGKFDFKLPHIGVEWQELAEDSILAKYLGISAIPHLYVEWYAKGGIVDGATLIGAGEAGKEAIIPLERNTGWIHMVAVQLKEELEKLVPSDTLTVIPMPAAASGALVPANAATGPAPLDLDSLANTIADAISSLSQYGDSEPIIKVYLDGKQLTGVVTEYQRRNSRAYG